MRCCQVKSTDTKVRGGLKKPKRGVFFANRSPPMKNKEFLDAGDTVASSGSLDDLCQGAFFVHPVEHGQCSKAPPT
jgi:hypothetical protein